MSEGELVVVNFKGRLYLSLLEPQPRLLTVLESVALDLPDGVAGRARIGLKFLSAALVRDLRPHLFLFVCLFVHGVKKPP